MTMKRFFDVLFSCLFLFLFLPVIVFSLAIVFLQDFNSPFFFQRRVGKDGVPFNIIKIRTMSLHRTGLALTGIADSRVTRIGKYLRKYKIDEFLQFANVLFGHMTIVGPRPEVPEYLDCCDYNKFLLYVKQRPGITDPTSLIFRNENIILSKFSDSEAFYIGTLLPLKIRISSSYASSSTILTDFGVMLDTFMSSFFSCTSQRITSNMHQTSVGSNSRCYSDHVHSLLVLTVYIFFVCFLIFK